MIFLWILLRLRGFLLFFSVQLREILYIGKQTKKLLQAQSQRDNEHFLWADASWHRYTFHSQWKPPCRRLFFHFAPNVIPCILLQHTNSMYRHVNFVFDYPNIRLNELSDFRIIRWWLNVSAFWTKESNKKKFRIFVRNSSFEYYVRIFEFRILRTEAYPYLE